MYLLFLMLFHFFFFFSLETSPFFFYYLLSGECLPRIKWIVVITLISNHFIKKSWSYLILHSYLLHYRNIPACGWSRSPSSRCWYQCSPCQLLLLFHQANHDDKEESTGLHKSWRNFLPVWDNHNPYPKILFSNDIWLFGLQGRQCLKSWLKIMSERWSRSLVLWLTALWFFKSSRVTVCIDMQCQTPEKLKF